MPNSYNVKILDKDDELIGEMMTASSEDVRNFINRGFKVVNNEDGTVITEAALMDTLGVSDGCIL